MATYPLKVKDGAGNVHTVGDPRIGAAAGDIPQASVNGLVAALAAKVGTSDSRLSDTRTPTDNTVATAKIVDGAVTSAKIADGTIVNADVNAAAAIALSKLATGALPSGITVASANLVDGTIVDADVNAAAAIAQSKISGLTTDLAAKAPLSVSINAQTASYTLVLADAGKQVEIGSASATTLTVPTNASVAFPVGTSIIIVQTGAGQITVAGAGGVTVNATPGLKLYGQWSSALLVKRATDTWLLSGDTAA